MSPRISLVTLDRVNPTSPVLAGSTSSFNLPISIEFEIAVDSVTLDAGYFDNLNSTRIIFFGPSGEILSTQFNSIDGGIESFTFAAADIPIAGVSAVAVRQEDAGFAIDNLVVGNAVSIALPELQDGQGDAESLEVWLGSIEDAVNTVQTDTLGPADQTDTFGFFAPHPVRVTYSVTSESNPNTVVEYESPYDTGTHFFHMADVEGYSDEEDYTLAVTSVVDTTDAAAAKAMTICAATTALTSSMAMTATTRCLAA